jgi:hypothetical protein
MGQNYHNLTSCNATFLGLARLKIFVRGIAVSGLGSRYINREALHRVRQPAISKEALNANH